MSCHRKALLIASNPSIIPLSHYASPQNRNGSYTIASVGGDSGDHGCISMCVTAPRAWLPRVLEPRVHIPAESHPVMNMSD